MVYLFVFLLLSLFLSTHAEKQIICIIDQYQAQIASALKPAFAADALPLVTCAACQTVLPFLNSNISLDNGILKRLVTLLTSKVVIGRLPFFPLSS